MPSEAATILWRISDLRDNLLRAYDALNVQRGRVADWMRMTPSDKFWRPEGLAEARRWLAVYESRVANLRLELARAQAALAAASAPWYARLAAGAARAVRKGRDVLVRGGRAIAGGVRAVSAAALRGLPSGAAGVAIAVVSTVVIGGAVYLVVNRDDGSQEVVAADSGSPAELSPEEVALFDEPFDQPQYLIHATSHGTLDRIVEDDEDLLYPVAPDGQGRFQLPDGSGGIYHYTSDFHTGPFETPREVCAAAAGRDSAIFSAWNSNEYFDCAALRR